MNNFTTKQRHLAVIPDLTPKEIAHIISDAFVYKNEYDEGKKNAPILDGKIVCLIFEKPSLRTRVAFEAAVRALGGQPVFQSGVEIFKRADGETRETVEDIAYVLERYCDCIIARVHSHSAIRKMTDSASVPVINALCDKHHPTQAIADLMTIIWHKPKYEKLKVTFVGDGNNVATSLMHICTMMGLHFVHSAPLEYEIPAEEWARGQAHAKKNGTACDFVLDPKKASQDADVVYTDTFVSMGDEAETEQRLKVFAPYQVTSILMKNAKPDAIFLHCLPAHRGEEVADDVIDSPQSHVFDLAECRMHTAKAILKFLLT